MGTQMLLYGHRGASAREPENTVASVVRAMADGADGVELDVRATVDGVPVLLHDRDLERTTSGRGSVDELTLAEVRAVDAGGGHPVPTLDEVCASIAGRLRLNLELKQAGIGEAVLGVLARWQALDWAVSSFDWNALRDVRRRAPTATLWPVAFAADPPLFAVARELGASTIAVSAAAVTHDVARRCREAAVAVMAWTVNDPTEARRLHALGVDALCVDDPAAIQSVLDDRRAAGASPDGPQLAHRRRRPSPCASGDVPVRRIANDNEESPR